MYIESCSSDYLYDHMGNLTNEGKAEYWVEVNKLIEHFDCRKIKLLSQVNEKEKQEYWVHKHKYHKDRCNDH